MHYNKAMNKILVRLFVGLGVIAFVYFIIGYRVALPIGTTLTVSEKIPLAADGSETILPHKMDSTNRKKCTIVALDKLKGPDVEAALHPGQSYKMIKVTPVPTEDKRRHALHYTFSDQTGEPAFKLNCVRNTKDIITILRGHGVETKLGRGKFLISLRD
jgi:hypothetical protein